MYDTTRTVREVLEQGEYLFRFNWCLKQYKDTDHFGCVREAEEHRVLLEDD